MNERTALITRTREQASEHVISLFRIAIGFMMLCHGLALVFGMLGGRPHAGGSIPALIWPDWWAALLQLVGGALILIGLFTRTTGFVMSGLFAIIYFKMHQSAGALPIQNGGEAAALYSFIFLLLSITGGGQWSLDRLIQQTQSVRPHQAAGQRAHDPKPSSEGPLVALE